MGYKGPFNRTMADEVTPTIDTNAYTAGDVVGGLLTFDVCAAGGGGTIRHAWITDVHSEGADLTLYLFNATPTSIADDAAFAAAITIADLKNLVAVVSFAGADFTTINNMDWQSVDVDKSFKSGDPNVLYGYLVDGTGGTWAAATNLTIGLVVWAD